MEQLLLHLWGDYLTQTDWMANAKRKQLWPALVHALVYGLPFMLLTQHVAALLTITLTHLVIDWLGLARYVVFAKNWLTDQSLTWADCQATGYPSARPAWLSVWLTIIADNTLHLTVNYIALRWL